MTYLSFINIERENIKKMRYWTKNKKREEDKTVKRIINDLWKL